MRRKRQWQARRQVLYWLCHWEIYLPVRHAKIHIAESGKVGTNLAQEAGAYIFQKHEQATLRTKQFRLSRQLISPNSSFWGQKRNALTAYDKSNRVFHVEQGAVLNPKYYKESVSGQTALILQPFSKRAVCTGNSTYRLKHSNRRL